MSLSRRKFTKQFKMEAVQRRVDGQARELAWQGDYLLVTNLEAGNRVSIEFPLPESTFFRTIGNMTYSLTVRGNNIIGIDPKGVIYPLYQKSGYESNKPPQKQRVTRFVADDLNIRW